MARTVLTPQVLAGAYPGSNPVPALTLVAADNVNGNQFTMVKGDILVIQNTDGAGAHTFTLSSVPDRELRTQDVTAQSVPANGIVVYGSMDFPGWQQSDGTFHLTASSALIFFAIIRPN